VEGQLFAHEVLAVVLRVRDRRLDCLLWQRAKAPFDGQWSLPRGPLGATERLGTSASRHLAAKVDITSIAHMEQLETRSDPDRDPRQRVLATAYLALVATDVSPRVPADTAWHPVDALPETAFDHGSIIGSARERLRAKLSYTNIGFALAPAAFTIAQLRDIYVASLGHPVSATNLQRILTRRGVIQPTAGTAPEALPAVVAGAGGTAGSPGPGPAGAPLGEAGADGRGKGTGVAPVDAHPPAAATRPAAKMLPRFTTRLRFAPPFTMSSRLSVHRCRKGSPRRGRTLT